MTRLRRHGTAACILTALTLLAPGCASSLPDRDARMKRGYVYYLDGAGGGGALVNYAKGVRKGLLAAGYPGAGEMFNWETGRGLTADQEASVPYKRQKAAELAERIAGFRRAHPGVDATLIGFSAGAAIAVFALEALPAEITVENVILLSGSLSADYELTPALQRVDGRMYVTTSHRDGMLEYLMPFTGTADRKSTEAHGSIGVDGVRLSPDASAEELRQYAKIVTLPWNAEFKRLGDTGGHFGTVAAPFVQAVVAPLVMSDAKAVAPSVVEGAIANPDYERWAAFGVGSWVRWRGYQVIAGVKTPLTIKAALVARDEHRLFIEREFETERGTPVQSPLSGRFVVAAQIEPGESPATAPNSRRTELPSRTITIGGRATACSGYRIEAAGYYPHWGTDVDVTIFIDDAIPGRAARIELRASIDGRPVEFVGEVVDFNVE